MSVSKRCVPYLAITLALVLTSRGASAQCPEAPSLQNFTGAGRVTCPCFAPGEQAGAVFTAPVGDYPLEILRVGIGWGSQLGGTPTSLEEAIHVYEGGLPNPGSPIFTLEGPTLNDGAINQFNLEPIPGEIVIDSGPFTVALEFLNDNQSIFAPSVVNDGNGCQPSKNVVFANPGFWADACALGVSGDWVFFVIYRPCLPPLGVGNDLRMLTSIPIQLAAPWPNPSRGPVELSFTLAQPGAARLEILDVSGRRIATLAAGEYAAGTHRAAWNGALVGGGRAVPGVYFAELSAAGRRARRTLLIAR